MQNDLKFSGSSPVVIDYNGDTTDIYAPVKTSSCDVNIVSDTILDDLYTASLNEIGVTIKKRVPRYDNIYIVTNRGSVETTEIDTNSDEFFNYYNDTTIFGKFFKDINGDFRFNGDIYKNSNDFRYAGSLKYNYNTKKWEGNTDWKMERYDKYFWCGSNSYKIWQDTTSGLVAKSYICVWNGSDWGTKYRYLYVDSQGNEYDMLTYPEKYIHFSDNSIEYISGGGENLRLTWNQAQLKWLYTTPYYDIDGGTCSLNGNWYHKIKDREGNWIHTIIVYDYQNSSTTSSYCVVKLDQVNGTYESIINLRDTLEIINPGIRISLRNFFTGDNGDLYYMDVYTGDIYYWSWAGNEWFKWITFRGDQNPNGLFELMYVIPGRPNTTAVIGYRTTSNKQKFIYLTGITEPTVSREYVPVPGEYVTKVIWEGYKLPNTYSQDVTQNLDTINMTCNPLNFRMIFITCDKNQFPIC